MIDRPPTVCFDIDGCIATGGSEVYGVVPPQYVLCVPIDATVRLLRRLRQEGVIIHLFTSRWQEDKELTVQWLLDHGVPFDSIQMGKPSADLYVDDRSYPSQYIPQRDSEIDRFIRQLKAIRGE